MDSAMWEKAVAFHGHECPGLALGVRLCEFVQARLGHASALDEELVCIAETDACPGDAIQALLGCTLGKGNFIYHCTGKTAYTFYDRASGEGFRVVAKRNQSPLSREERKQQIFTAPLEELFTVTEPKEPLPEKARIFTTLTCACCGEGVAEHMAHLQNGQVVCPHCFRPYDR